MLLAQFDTAAFLRDTWQRKPLLIRNPWARWHNPLDPDDLAGLACEAEVESRLVTGGGGEWALEHGPIPEDRFAALGNRDWTLLVQAVDHHVPDVAALIEPFRFVPDWRIDDVMVSYAADSGGVGPHFDQYDVFLIQGLGRRRWRIGQRCDETSPLLPHPDLRLLADFAVEEEWVLEPGDILYVPPGVAHDGVALGGDCMTYSIGFRAPARSELIAGWCDEVLGELADDDRYADPGLPAQANPGEITAEAIARLHAMVTQRLLDRDAFARWFGGENSTPRYPEVDWRPDEPIAPDELRTAIAQGTAIHRNPASRFSFIAAQPLLLFVDGQCFECEGEAADFARQLCAETGFAADPRLARSDGVLSLIAALYDQGSLALDQDD